MTPITRKANVRVQNGAFHWTPHTILDTSRGSRGLGFVPGPVIIWKKGPPWWWTAKQTEDRKHGT